MEAIVYIICCYSFCGILVEWVSDTKENQILSVVSAIRKFTEDL